MPLLGKKLFNCVKSISNSLPEETIFTIPHTKERFRSKDDYEKRLSLYKERIWTCQCTGHINLSHEEAWNSEKAVHKTLKAQFTECYQKPVLQVVHHSTLPLENLVDQTWLKLQQVLSLGEKVSLKVLTGGQVIKAAVVKVDPSGVEADPTSNCSSPSSDKENTVGNKSDSSPKKWVPPKLLAYKYSIRLEDEDKIINAVPASEIVRTDKPPSKELLRLFIRAHAVRAGQTPTAPWVVDENLVKKYSLPSKYADFLLSPVKMAEVSKRAEKEITKKRKSISRKSEASSNKKLKFEKSAKNRDNKKQCKLMGSPMKKSDKKTKKAPKFVNGSSSEEESSGNYTIVKKTSDKKPRKISPKKSHKCNPSSSSDGDNSDTDCILVEIKQNKIVISCSSDSDSDSDVPLSKVTKLSRKHSKSEQASPNHYSSSKKATPKKEGSLKNSNEKTPIKKIKTPTKSNSKKTISSFKKKTIKKEEKKSPKKPTKGMKQMTLLDMKRKGLKTPDRPIKKVDSPPRTPGIVKELLKLMKTDDKSKIGLQLRKVAICLSAVQRDRLPVEIKNIVQKKFKDIEEKKKLKMMTPESKKAYLSKKRKEVKQKMAEVRKAKQEEERKRFEDQKISGKALPIPKLVPMPEGLPNELFGDIAMITEFINCFSKLLMPDEDYPIYTDALMKALAVGKNGFAYLSTVLKVLLQTLLQDEISENYSDLKIPLSDIPVNQFTASELVRLCLRKMDDADDDSDHTSDVEDEELEVADDVIQMLEGQELYELDIVDKIKIIKGLCLRIMGSYSVQDYMEEKQRDASKLWLKKMAGLKEKNDRLREEKKNKLGHDTKQSKENLEEKDGNDEGLTISHFYGKVEPKSDPTASDAQEDVDDLASVVKRRRIMSALAAKEKEKRDKEEKLKREKEIEALKIEREKENFEKFFQEGISLAKTVLRLVPIGTDRNHNRYWIFNTTAPGLYIEKGWINDDIDYRIENPKVKEESNASSSDEMSASESDATDLEKTKMTTVETTVPHIGQNLWFTYDSLKDLDSLIECLHPLGFRESVLKAELEKRYVTIVKSINAVKRIKDDIRDTDGEEEMTKGLKKELLETELKLRNGGLGGVEDFDLWDKKLESSTDISVLAECLLETQEHVTEKFLQGVMKRKKIAGSILDEETGEEKEADGDDEEITVKGNIQEPVKLWREAVENASTLSRLHVLLGMLDSCIKWEKSAENAKCKICRKKGNDDRLLLCDDCNQAFHIYCLRPALSAIPNGDWFCPACIPDSARRKSRSSSYHYASDADSENETEHEENCAECGGDEGLILCAECPLAYHLECHDPPLRHPPRGRWVCNECKNGVKRKKRSRPRRRAPVSRKPVKRKRDDSSSTDEDDSSSEDEEEEDSSTDEEEQQPPAKSARRTIQQTSRSRSKKTKVQSQSKKVTSSAPAPRALSRRAPSDLSICEDILNQVMSNSSSWPFLTSVDKKEVPDYYKIIKRPMDFTLIKNKLACLNYGLPEEFAEDVALVFRNAAEYNKLGSEVLDCMEKCEKFFVGLLHKKLPAVSYNRQLGSAAGSGRSRR